MHRSFFAAPVAALIVIACGSEATTHVVEPVDSGAPVDSGVATPTDSGVKVDAGGSTFDAANDPADGTPTRKACTESLGNAISTFHGRLDGYLVSIVPPSQHTCNGDSTHVHLQVLAHGGVYDVAVNVDGLAADLDHAMVGGAWTEGWNTNGVALDYPTSLGIHSPAFVTTNAKDLIAALANVNHISVFATGYGPTGIHLVHRKPSGADGAIIADPLGKTPHYFVFRFDTDTAF